MKKLLIIGAGIAGQMLCGEILTKNELKNKYKIVGFLDDNISIKEVFKIPVLGNISKAKEIIEENNIDEVIIAIPSASQSVIQKIINSIPSKNINIKIVPPFIEIIEGNFTYQQIRNIEPSDLLGREEVGFDLDKISPYYDNKVVFITGGGGSIGSEIVEQLMLLPIKKVIALGHGENSIHNLIQKYGDNPKFDYVIGDIKDYDKINYELSKFKPDILFHAAAHKHVTLMEKYPDEAIKNNVLGTYNCAIASIKNEIKKFILISTDKAVNPTSVMGASKRIAERIVIALNEIHNKTKFSVVRFGNVLGSRGSVIPIFKEQIEKGGPITITHPDITRYFMSIREAARLVIKSITIDEGNIFILDMGKPIKIMDLAKSLIKIYGYKEDDIKIKIIGLRKGEKLYEEVLTKQEEIEKTPFEKIFISKHNENILNNQELDLMLNKFTNAILNHKIYNNEDIKKLIKEYVPEYTNSID